jgi:energy-coupling factor transport system substrate-specific component
MNRLKFETKDLILIALMAAMGLAVKPLVKSLTHLISTPLGIPGGTLTGGLYMLWLSLALALVPKTGTATLVGLLQGIVVLVTGWFGSHGAISLITYPLPGLMVDLLALVYLRYNRLDGQIIYCTLANLTGTWIVGLIIMKLPKLPLYLALSMSILSGMVGGVLSYLIYKEIKRYRLV